MICSAYRCLFVHIPKTAGVSIERVFLRLMGLSWETRAPLLLRPNADPRRGPPRLAHLTAAEYVTCGYLTAGSFASHFKFAFVRDPWDRIVSEYKYRRYSERIEFKRYLFEHFPAPGWTDTYRHVMPQYDFLFDQEGRLLVDFVGRFERLQADFDVVCTRLGLSRTEVPHANRSAVNGRPATLREGLRRFRALWSPARHHTFPHYSGYYDDESRAFVADVYRRDIEAFNYTFDDGTRPEPRPLDLASDAGLGA
jgi:hypothetical protein